MELPEFLEEGPLGEIRIKDHRIYLLHLVEDYNGGATVEVLAEQLPTVSRDMIQRVIDFYLRNRAEVDEYVERCEAEMDRNYAAARRIDLEELRRRLKEMRQSGRA